MNFNLIGKVVANWTLFALYVSGFYVMTASVFFPNVLPRKYNNFLTGMTGVVTQTPPFSWFGLSPDQMVFVALAIDMTNIFAILSWPKLSGILAMISLSHRQFFLRYNEDNPALPNSPLCGYRAPHCGNMDLVQIAIGVCAALVYTSERAFPELTLKMMRGMGFQPPGWTERWRSTFRRIVPERKEVTRITTAPAHIPTAQGTAEKETPAVPSEAARKNI
jgi:hypothetical protein